MSEYRSRDPRNWSPEERSRHLAEIGLPLIETADGTEVSYYRGVWITWTSTLDDRITLVIDALPDAQRSRLHTAYAHKGGCSFAWDGPPPVGFTEQDGIGEEDVPGLNDYWVIDRSFDRNPPVQLPNRLASLPYDLYLETDHWKQLREKAIAHYGETCVLCDRQPVQVHHRTYVRRGFERLTDLIVLCDDCHSRYHGKTA